MNKFKRVTLHDIAIETGVSYATVSAVLNPKKDGNIRVGKEKKELITLKAQELGYVPNQVARSLKTTDKNLISVFTYENMRLKEIRDEFYGFLLGIHSECEIQGLDLLILNTRKNISASSRITMSAGSIMIGVNRDDRDIQSLLKRNFPIVFVGRRSINSIKTNWVSFDYKSIINKIVALISQQGYSKVAFINNNANDEPNLDKTIAINEITKKMKIQVDNIFFTEESEPIDNFKQALFDNDVYLVNRIWQIPLIEKFLKKNHFTLGIDKKAILLEDDWQHKYSHWTRWKGEREQLGSLALLHLDAIIQGKPLPSKKLVPLELIMGKSFN
ncbi:MAG: LacI family DNA-binding transcriptional regulator [Spirochaetaceae bacterium]|nr:LacI family DNA-binding transcriptional regulator [Spirochaetaceae bacterium]